MHFTNANQDINECLYAFWYPDNRINKLEHGKKSHHRRGKKTRSKGKKLFKYDRYWYDK